MIWNDNSRDTKLYAKLPNTFSNKNLTQHNDN